MYVLGIDGGGSKTFALVADEYGQLCGFGRAGPSNHQGVGLDGAMSAVQHAAQTALEGAGITSSEVAKVVCGLGGADLSEDFIMLHHALEGLNLGRHIELHNDALVALRAGISQSWGVVLICGTGFNAAGRAPSGQEFRFPALGWISGDWGGAGTLAIEMVRLVMRADDGRGTPTHLTRLLLDALAYPSPHDLMRALYHQQIDLTDLRTTVPLLFQAAEQGDPPAQSLLIALGEELGLSAVTVIKRLAMEVLPVEVVLGGSVFKGQGLLLTDTISRVIHQTAPLATLVRPSFEPVVGAVLLGLEAVGVEVGRSVYQKLRDTMPYTLSTTVSHA